MRKITTYCGFVAIVGRTNVGKSTLFNQLLGHKVSITSCKPQTTRLPIRGIHTKWPYQAIYIDTPGVHIKGNRLGNRLINRVMNRIAITSIREVALILFVVEGTNWTRDDQIVLNRLRDVNSRVILVINKIDQISCKKTLLPHIKFLNQQMPFHEIVPICAENGININNLADIVRKVLPVNEHHFLEDHITDHSQRFIASEIIREKIMRFFW